jgi:signal transduction histidine kinase
MMYSHLYGNDCSDLERLFQEQQSPIFQYTVENAVTAILATNADYQIVYANSACNELLTQSVKGKPLSSLWFEEDLPLLNKLIDWSRNSGFFSASRLNGFRSVINSCSDIEIVGIYAADWNRQTAQAKTEDLLKINPPGTLDVIWAASSEMALGVIDALEFAGREQEVKVFSNDLTPETADFIRHGGIVAETYHGFAEWGWYGTQFAVMLALGQAVPRKFDIRPRTACIHNIDCFYALADTDKIDWDSIKASHEIPDKIRIGWIQESEAGPWRTATSYLEQAAVDARTHGIHVEILTRKPSYWKDMIDVAMIIDDFIGQGVNVLIFPAIALEVIKSAIRRANNQNIPVIIVNQLEPIEGVDVACYIGFDNTVAGMVSGYAVLDYLNGGLWTGVKPCTELDLAEWRTRFNDLGSIDVKGRVAIIEGISGRWRGENRLKRAYGSEVYVDTITYPLYNRSGKFMGMMAAFRDASERKKTEQEIFKLNHELEQRVVERTQKLEEANEELQSFTYSVSHDLRAPLRAINGFSKLLQDNYAVQFDEQGQHLIQRIHAVSQQMTQLINDMLQLSRVSQQEMRRQKVNLSLLAEQIITELRQEAPVREVSCSITPDIVVYGDAGLLRCFLNNLIGNAWKFTGNVAYPHIEFRCEERAVGRVYLVRDNGAGFDPTYTDRLFVPFQRLHSTQEFAGTGIGLSIVQRIVRRHGGSVWAESDVGNGATFYFTIPEQCLS